jgi:hypothetical protein
MDPKSRSFIGAVASAIKALALLLIDLIHVGEKAVAMADKAIDIAQERQYVELDIQQADYATRLRNQVALRQVKEEQEARQFMAADPERAELMKAARANIERIIARSQAELAARKNA